MTDFFELQSRNTPLINLCIECSSKTSVIKLIHPPRVIRGRVYHFRSDPLVIQVQECFDFNDLMKLSGISAYSAAPISTPEEIEGSLDIIKEKVLSDLAAKVAPKQFGGTTYSDSCLLQKLGHNYQIIAKSLPTTKGLVAWGSQDIHEKASLFPTDAESVLDAILVQYLKGEPFVPLVRNCPLNHSFDAK